MAPEEVNSIGASASPELGGEVTSTEVHKEALEAPEPQQPTTLLRIKQRGAAADIQIQLSDVLLTALIPALLYVSVFAYEFGYFSFFNVPTTFIQLDWVSALNALVSLRLVILRPEFIFVLPVLAMRTISDDDFVLIRGWFYFIGVVTLGIISYLTVVWVFILDGLIALLMFWRLSVLRKRQTTNPSAPPDKHASLWDWLTLTLGRTQFLNGLTALFLLAIFYEAGWNQAAQQRVFLVQTGNPPKAVLANFAETLVLSPYRRASSSECGESSDCYIRSAEFTIIKLSDKEPLTLKRKTLGILRVHPYPPEPAGTPWWQSTWHGARRRN